MVSRTTLVQIMYLSLRNDTGGLRGVEKAKKNGKY